MPSNLNYTQQLPSEKTTHLFCCTCMKCKTQIPLPCSPPYGSEHKHLFVYCESVYCMGNCNSKTLVGVRKPYICILHVVFRLCFYQGWLNVQFPYSHMNKQPNLTRAKVEPFWFLQYPWDHKMILLAWNSRKRNGISAGQRDRGDILREQL